ncbi:MAG: DNA-binding Lrp family transcriptional regulator [Natronomonas sp.]|jgi:DNA-binding Lrp family transcriptional regulator|uniref:Lrp/AsnC ligand binding domain-containing protein n=1 Tax=Natronomonas sp. TaxID=2184060 RepID=UPI003989FC23
MVHAFIMVTVDTGHAEALVEMVRAFDHVSDANVIAGNFDIVVEADAGEVYDVINSVATRIRGLDAVTDTKTYVCLE